MNDKLIVTHDSHGKESIHENFESLQKSSLIWDCSLRLSRLSYVRKLASLS